MKEIEFIIQNSIFFFFFWIEKKKMEERLNVQNKSDLIIKLRNEQYKMIEKLMGEVIIKKKIPAQK